MCVCVCGCQRVECDNGGGAYLADVIYYEFIVKKASSHYA